ncbi:TetR/AcrR family transcriptional regulator [Azorhizobium doebereinerae]|uniref:TetR/AcrR family transcriptional regulator n=1 Tax=Azorhizobium doebereinerae TaxID=281091 RepID=UPI00040C168A|nr:TetR/AcrR family transcriptional regulator [Azorhizobium doebereinerae]
MPPTEVRERVLAAAVGLLRAQGPAGLTQPRVAKAAGVSQSHLTYYFPTRADLVRAVLEAAVDGQIANLGDAMAAPATPAERIARLAEALTQAENTRVLVSLVLAADGDPAFRDLYGRLVAAMRGRAAGLIAGAGLDPTPAQVALLHALGTGLAVMGAALGPEAGREVNAMVLSEVFRLLGADAARAGEGDAGPSGAA